MMKVTNFLTLLIVLSTVAPAATVVELENYLLYSDGTTSRKVNYPQELRQASNFSVQLDRPISSQPQAMNVNPTGAGGGGGPQARREESLPPENTSLASLLFRAKAQFTKKQFDEAMSTLDVAEKIAPQDAAVKSMKGSLFLLRGMKEQARQYWTESLQLNPNQPRVKTYLDRLGPAPNPSPSEVR